MKRSYTGIFLAFLLELVLVIISIGVVWFAFWFCNFFVILLTAGISAIGILLSQSGTFLKIIGFILDGLWLYGAAYALVLMKASGVGDSSDSSPASKSFYYTYGGLLTMLIIIIYDPSIAYYMPGFLEDGIRFLQDDLNFHIVEGFDWGHMEFPGPASDSLYLICFDIELVLAYLLVGQMVGDKR